MLAYRVKKVIQLIDDIHNYVIRRPASWSWDIVPTSSESGLFVADFPSRPKIKRPRAGTRGANEVWALGIPQVWVFTPRQKTTLFPVPRHPNIRGPSWL